MKLYNNNPRAIKYVELEMVEGNTVQSRFFIRDFLAGIRKMFGLEVIEYTEMLRKARGVAKDRMIKQAEELGANAIINVRYMTSEITEQASEVIAYGTAVKVKK
ncbi:hypothetical protein LCGC14_2984440 [marine sediment metagenome]|uniref:Uncharacterized protein n=1 Tax=marine sediment metagenome TaxID=412755 RepID=A0A0F8XT87_9ZZZZ